MKKGFFLVVFFTAISLASRAESPKKPDTLFEKIVRDLIYDQDEKYPIKKQEQFKATIGYRHINGFIENYNWSQELFLNANYQFKKSWVFYLNQSLRCQRFINSKSSDTCLRLSDTSLSLQKILNKLPFNSSARLGLSSSLPTSALSQVERLQGTLNTSKLYLNWSMALLPALGLETTKIKSLNLLVQPMARYYFSLYKTTPTAQNSVGGRPLPWFSLGVQRLALSLSLTDSLSFSTNLGYWFIFLHKISYLRDKHSPYKQSYPINIYNISLSGNWQITKQWGLSLSYSLNDRVNRQGRSRVLFFDDRYSSWAFSVYYNFSNKSYNLIEENLNL